MADAIDGGDAEAEGDGAEHRRSTSRNCERRAEYAAGCASPIASVATPSGILMAKRYGHVPIDRIAEATVGPTAGGDRDHQRVEADAAAQQRVRIGEADQRRVDAHDPCGAKSLHDARHRQQQQCVRKRAKQRMPA